jgi:hypothetical protein
MWEIKYENNLASEWLERQESGIREAVRQWMSPAGGGPPGNQQIKGALLEYLMYKESHASNTNVHLYYVINRANNRFEGWGIAPPVVGRATPLTLQVRGSEEDAGRRVILHFSQAAQHVKIGDLEGDIKAFHYTVEFEARRGRDGMFEGKFFHPECDRILVGRSSLVSMED